MNGVRATWGGIGVAILATVLGAGTASGELLTKKSLSLEDAVNVRIPVNLTSDSVST